MTKLCITLEEAADCSGIGINRLRTIAKDVDCPFVLRVGTSKTLVKVKAFERWIDEVTFI